MRITQVGVQFIQVGNDPAAARFLDELDRNLVKEMGEYARVGFVCSSVRCSYLTHNLRAIGYRGHRKVQRERP